MSDDLIRRIDVIEALKDNMVEMGGDDFSEMGVHSDDIDAVINGIPAIEPKRGKWIVVDTEVISVPVYWNKEQKESDEKGAGIQEKCKCSVCGRKVNFMGYKKLGVIKSFNFCPNCGAKMKGADDE